ncbi:MAG TPA: hypothetical protein PKA63_12915 [Oligoflexia bacterium]|nr:hypothetical protein [Oligoflexia bacterium]HMP49560.1 hypothetical protein [Oligoflexia bacterium]
MKIPTTKIALFLIFLFPVLLLLSTFAISDDCIKCKKRKRQMCEEECALVRDEENLKQCYHDCTNEYCVHKCKKPEPDPETSNPETSDPENPENLIHEHRDN